MQSAGVQLESVKLFSKGGRRLQRKAIHEKIIREARQLYELV